MNILTLNIAALNMPLLTLTQATSVLNKCFHLLQGCCDIVDTTALVRSCVQSAVGLLRDQVESGLRSTQRVEILLTLLSDNDEVKGTNNDSCPVFLFQQFSVLIISSFSCQVNFCKL